MSHLTVVVQGGLGLFAKVGSENTEAGEAAADLELDQVAIQPRGTAAILRSSEIAATALRSDRGGEGADGGTGEKAMFRRVLELPTGACLGLQCLLSPSFPHSYPASVGSFDTVALALLPPHSYYRVVAGLAWGGGKESCTRAWT